MASIAQLLHAPNAAGSSKSRQQSSDGIGRTQRHWPVDICICCSPALRWLLPIPRTYTQFQDLLHALMLCGIASGAILISQAFGSVCQELRCRQSRLPCLEEFLIVVSVVPSSFQISRIVSMYDTDLTVKEAEAKAYRQQLEEDYDAYTRSMEQQLSKTTESTATMAERNFEDHRRDFLKWLAKAETDFNQMPKRLHQNRDNLNEELAQLRRFVSCWLKVFEECSVDPLSHPKLIVDSEELDCCKSVTAVVRLVSARLRNSEVKFITSQRAADDQMLEEQRKQKMLIKRRHSSNAGLVIVSGPPGTPVAREIELTTLPSRPAAPVLADDVESAPPPQGVGSGSQDVEVAAQVAGRCSWFKVGFVGLGLHRSEYGYPVEIYMLCARLVLLSKTHATFLIGLISAIVLIFLQVINDFRERANWRLLCCGLYTSCMSALLWRFEQFDDVQKLIAESIELEHQSKRVRERHDQMMKFWETTQSLVDIWVHRTVPRMNLLGEMQQLVADANPQDKIALMTIASKTFEDIEQALPELQMWQQGGRLPELKKKRFSDRFAQLCAQASSIPTLAQNVKEILGDGFEFRCR